MKRIIYTLAAIVTLFFISCNAGGKKYEIKMKLAEGDHFQNNSKMDMNMQTNMAGQSMDMKMGMDFACFFDVTKSTPDEKQLKMTYSRAKMTMDMGQMNGLVNTDSLLEKQNGKLIGKSLTIVLSKDNEIKDVTGAESILQDPNADEQTKEMMKKMASKEQVNSMFGMMFSIYPKKPVAVGETWDGENKINMGEFEMLVKTKYTLVSVTDGVADIKVDGKISGKGIMTRNKMEMEMNGSQVGNMKIKLADGYLDQGKYTMDLAVTMEAAGQKIPMKLNADYVMSGK